MMVSENSFRYASPEWKCYFRTPTTIHNHCFTAGYTVQIQEEKYLSSNVRHAVLSKPLQWPNPSSSSAAS